ncbi:conserved exported hypothetical protein [Luteimonas sp. 9C]|uniref:transporter n=1 Tax=Luteimonas sp. 9C TaxID=2653148 RepID=UPI0012EF6B0B|nr:transporter [Luteimonas sp. 9C]VXB62146.1 conserved exported hypothetical protein [Luteimonas sp. 9C]
MITSAAMRVAVLAGAVGLLAFGCAAAQAQDASEVAFDRPGIGFSPSVLAPGQVAWEQGLPDIGHDDSDGVRTTRYAAASLLRVGLAEDLELQIGSDSRVWERTRSANARERVHGGGDSSVALKWVLPGSNDTTQWAVLARQGVLTGASDIRAGRAQQDLGVSIATGDLAFYVNGTRDEDGTGWTASPSWTWLSTPTVEAYLEAGVGTGSQRSRALGSGITWRVATAVQLDVSVLRGFADAEDDWRGGFGVSVLLH